MHASPTLSLIYNLVEHLNAYLRNSVAKKKKKIEKKNVLTPSALKTH